jgi:hypothetical protein
MVEQETHWFNAASRYTGTADGPFSPGRSLSKEMRRMGILDHPKHDPRKGLSPDHDYDQ